MRKLKNNSFIDEEKKDKSKSDDKLLSTFERVEQEYEKIKQRFLKSVKDEERKDDN